MGQWFHDKDIVLRQLFLVLLDVITVICASTMALWVRFDFSIMKIEKQYLDKVWLTMLPNILMVLVVYWLFKLYRSVWKYASVYEMQNIFLAGMSVTVLQLISMSIAKLNMPRSYWFLYAAFLIAG
ncbi:MAG: hypothetical protein IKW44_03850, partial [Bacteroidaceae bacterium]|nr:hypothetical protein [Bacteroidaceae bacterium]